MGFVGDFRDVFVVDWVLFVEGVYSRGRVDIGRVVVLMWGILIHGVVRGLREVWPCGNHSHNIGFSLFLLHTIFPQPLITRIHRSNIIKLPFL